MPMLIDPSTKYPQRIPMPYSQRTWPDKRVTQAPIWMNSDLRDGNQALPQHMNIDEKLALYDLLVHEIGFKEVEVSFPSASDTEFAFTRKLIDEKRIPSDVAIVVLTQAKPKLIERTMEAIKGAPNVIFHFYVATSENFRNVVFHKPEQQVIDMAVTSTQHIRRLAEQNPDTGIQLEFSLEHASDTDVHVAKRMIDAVVDAWGATPNKKVIINAPATVECDGPHVYADKIEWLSRNIAKRDCVILSVHPHNDRGCAIAATELGLLAGADRVEGTLFNSGERTGNVDIATLALNMYTHGVSPKLNFSNMPHIVDIWQRCTKMTVPPRHPYAGDLVFTAFSGSHQDAIKKGMDQQKPGESWAVPYIPIDPLDVGRTYEDIIRITSQSGKAAIAAVLKREKDYEPPPALIEHFSAIVQDKTEDTGKEITGKHLIKMFDQEYRSTRNAFQYVGHQVCEGRRAKEKAYAFTLKDPMGQRRFVKGYGNGPVAALFNAFGLSQRDAKVGFHSHSLGEGGPNARAAAYIDMRIGKSVTPFFGMGISTGTDTAPIVAALNAINGAYRANAFSLPDRFLTVTQG